MSVVIRPATERDLAACYDVWLSTEDEQLRAPGVVRPAAGTVLPLHEHELRSGTLVVAIEGIGGVGAGDEQILGFGATLTRSGVLYLADLFVRPSHHGRGIGRAMLHAMLDRAPTTRFTFASTDPAARSLYASFGMRAQWDLLHLEASTASLAVEHLDPDGIVAVPATVDDVADLDGRLTGRDRRVDLEHERDRLGFTCFLLQRASAVVGYGVVIHPQWWVPWKPNGTRVAPVIVHDARDAPGAVAATMRAALDLGATDITTFVPGPHPALPMLESAGFVTTGEDAYMASTPNLIPERLYLPPVDVP
ncbi:MAG TPA: GNAT family N-acetyltransferase [Acidimicrobiia bacterium]